MVVLHLFTFLLIPGLITTYIRFIDSSGLVPVDRRTLWIVLLVLGNVLTFPLFWYRFIVRGTAQS